MNQHFGRIPTRMTALYRSTVDSVRNKVVSRLPSHADEEIRALTMEMVLQVIFEDWAEFGNTEGLAELDWDDLASFIELAARLAGKDLSNRNRPIYLATLQNLLSDWLYNWNVNGEAGPPDPRARTRIKQNAK